MTVGVTLALDDHNRLQAHKMVLTSKTRLGKRKLEIKEVRKEKQVVASKKHDNKCFKATETSTKDEISATRKPQTKADLIDQMDLMKQLNDALLEEVKSNEEAIAILEGKEKKYMDTIKSLKEQVEKLGRETSPKSKSASDLETQTSSDPGDSELRIPCGNCVYVATCEEEFSWHMDYEHDINTDMQYETDFPCEICAKWCRTEADLTHHLKRHAYESDSLSLDNGDDMMSCNFCKRRFKTNKEVMVHKKKEHSEKVEICWNYSTGKCEFGADLCWFLHTNSSKSCEIDCNICGKVFTTLNQFLNHKKIEHVASVQQCTHEKNNSCPYGAKKCWYLHSLPENNEVNNVNQEVIEKIFNMMEQFTKRILNLENKTALQ